MKKQKKRGVNVTASPEAHERMFRKASRSKPRQTLREHLNLINGLPKEL